MVDNTEEMIEIAVLVGVDTGRGDDRATPETMNELAELAHTAGAQVRGRVIQNRQAPDVATYIGEGKLKELAELCRMQEANLIIFDHELSGSQQRNIEQEAQIRVIDRTMLILDIFARRAASNEGKLQVELAQMKYMLPRLVGMGLSLSRQGAGIGTRGPGETKLETDRRHIRRKISALEKELFEVAQRREYIRNRRTKDNVQTVAIVGYTNAGKSTLLNTLASENIYVEDKLFATLDTTARGVALPDGREAVFVDTVGFIRKLPHHLVQAFKSTLEEAAYASLILNVIDVTSDEYHEHVKVTEEILHSLGCSGIPILKVYNKCDMSPDLSGLSDGVCISAASGMGIDTLLEEVASHLAPLYERMKLLIPYPNASLASALHEEGILIHEEYLPEGILVQADVENKYVYQYKQYEL